MPRKVHDFFAKEWMKELLADFGEVNIERAVASEVRTIDLVFSPDLDRLDTLKPLGLLGRILRRPCPIEFFRNAVPSEEIINCRNKNADLRSELVRLAAQSGEPLEAQNLPLLWIITPTLSKAKQASFCMVKNPSWGQGVYFLPENDFTSIIVVHQLPATIETLWLRLLGKGKVQANAVRELLALPEDHTYRRETLHHLARLQVNLQMRQNRTKDLREVIMNLAPAYEKWYDQTIEEGKQLGLTEGKQLGLTEGKQLGLTEAEEKIARRLLARNMQAEEVAELTDLSLSQIEALQQKLPN